MWATKLRAFYRRDWLLAASYRLTFWSDLARTLFYLLSFFFVGRLIAPASAGGALAPYGGDYFQFVLLGIVFSGFMSSAMGSVTESIAFEQSTGTLDILYLSPTGLWAPIVSKTLLRLFAVGGRAVVLLAAGCWLSPIRFSAQGLLPSLAALALMSTAYFGIGLSCAAAYLAWRDSTPVERLIDGISRFLGGVYFPIAVLPHSVQNAARWLPSTEALEIIRRSTLGGDMTTLAPSFVRLALVAAVATPTGIFMLRAGLQRARRLGTLSLY